MKAEKCGKTSGSRYADPRLKKKASAVAELLKELYPDARCSLEYNDDPWRLLVMARLSAQCTDERVNIVSRELFQAYPTALAMSGAPLEDVERLVRPCGLYRTKAKSIISASRAICQRPDRSVPDNMTELLQLDGVGRKIANLIMGDVYGKGGIVADTHCIRICGRLGFYPEDKKDPLYTEKVMSSLLPAEEQSDFCHRLVLFGRDCCRGRGAPKCEECRLSSVCDKYGGHEKTAGTDRMEIKQIEK